MADSDSSDESIFIGPITLKEMKYHLTKKYYTPSTKTRHTFSGCPNTAQLPTQENPGYEADHEMSVVGNNDLNLAEENSSPNNSVIPLEDSLENNSYYKGLHKDLSTIVLSDTDEDDNIQLTSETNIKQENTSGEKYNALADESEPHFDNIALSANLGKEHMEYQCKPSVADTSETNEQIQNYSYSAISTNNDDRSFKERIQRFSENHSVHDREQSLKKECYAGREDKSVLKEDLQRPGEINEHHSGGYLKEYGSYDGVLTDNDDRRSFKVNLEKPCDTDDEYEREQNVEYHCGSYAGILAHSDDSSFKNGEQKPNETNEYLYNKNGREQSLKYQYGTYADIDDRRSFGKNQHKPTGTNEYRDDEYKSAEHQYGCYAGISTDSDDRHSFKENVSKPSEVNDYTREWNEKEQSAEYSYGSYAGISTDSDDRYSAKENVPRPKKKLQKNKYDYIVSSVGAYMKKPNTMPPPKNVKKVAVPKHTPSKPLTPKNNVYDHIVSPLAAYIKSAPETPLYQKVVPKPMKSSIPVPKSATKTAPVLDESLPRVVYQPAKHRIVGNKTEVKLPGSVKTLFPQDINVIKHTERIRKDKNVDLTRALEYDESLSDFSAVNDDISVLSVKNAYIK